SIGSPADSFWQQACTPVFQQRMAAARVAPIQALGRLDAVGTEVTEGFAQFAPGHHDACRLEESDGQRPDRAFGVTTAFVAVADAQTLLVADGVTQYRKLHGLRPVPTGADHQRG